MRNTVINKNDYEQYLFPVSLSAVLKKNWNKTIYSELEKRHPCFSDVFCYDVIPKICRKGLFFDVVVMTKLRLMEYKQKSKTLNFGFRLESGNKLLRFINKRVLLFYLLIGVCSIFSLIQFFRCFFLQKEQIQSNQTIAEERIENSVIPIENTIESYDYMLHFFEIVNNQKGSINSLHWKLDGLQENLSVNVKNIYPESLTEIAEGMSVVVGYENEKPFFPFKWSWPREMENLRNHKIINSENEMCYIRGILKQNGCQIIEETNTPIKVRFISKNNLWVLKDLYGKNLEKNLAVTEIEINRNGTDDYLVNMSFSSQLKGSEGLNTEWISDYEMLFERSNKVVNKTDKTETIKEVLKPIGSISYENGEKLVFYKDEKGKLIKRMEAF